MLADHQRLQFGQVNHLPGNMAGCHRLGQRLAACGTGWRIVADDRIRRLGLALRLAGMAGLPAPLLAGGLPRTADPRRLPRQQRDEFVLRKLVERFAVRRLLGIGQPKSRQANSCSGFVVIRFAPPSQRPGPHRHG